MSSYCSTCAKPFGGFFGPKELGCPSCKFTFCKNCLNKKIPDPANPKKNINVCLRCFNYKSANQSPDPKKQPQKPVDLLKLDDEKEKVTDPILQPMNSSTSDSNFDILSRLEALKKDDLPDVTGTGDDDIGKRLANLKGVEHKDYSTSNKMLFVKDTRTATEQTNDLMKQFYEEKAIDDEATPTVEEGAAGTIADIERRLAILRGHDLQTTKNQIEQIEETEEDETERTMKQYIEEAKLPDEVFDDDERELLSSIPKAPSKDTEELPWCEICNEDATLRCLECENLFCVRCFKEFHYEEDYKDHKTAAYKAPKSVDT
ncbi:unnamed protein product [Diamesa tonsa]